MLVGAVVVEDGVDDLPGRDEPLDRVEELDGFLMPVLLHTCPACASCASAGRQRLKERKGECGKRDQQPAA